MTGFQTVNGLAGLLIVTSVLVTLAQGPVSAARFYAAQSSVLVLAFVALGATTGSHELYLWSVSAFLTKVVLVPLIIVRVAGKLGDGNIGSGGVLSRPVTVLLAGVVVVLCFVLVSRVALPGVVDLKPALAVSLAHFFLGLACIVTQRNILKQVFGYCLMENGSHLTLALLAPNAPELVEVGIATDAIFAVAIMAVLVSRISVTFGTLDARQLTSLKG